MKRPKPIRVLGAPPKKGMCRVRPPLYGSTINPMLFCGLKKGHAGRHTWEKNND